MSMSTLSGATGGGQNNGGGGDKKKWRGLGSYEGPPEGFDCKLNISKKTVRKRK